MTAGPDADDSQLIPRRSQTSQSQQLQNLRDSSHPRPVRLDYQPPANNNFLSEQTSYQQSASSTFLSEQKSAPAINHQPNDQADDLPA
jgi:hypothetical protein